MPRRRSTKIGRLQPPMDVRKKDDIPEFESMLSTGPLTIVLVYADWCGHCTQFKENMWNKASAMPNKSVNTANVHYDMLENTSLANSKIEGYPSLLMVGTDKKPANFRAENGSMTNAMPQPTSAEELKQLLNAPVTEPVRNANSLATKLIKNNTALSANGNARASNEVADLDLPETALVEEMATETIPISPTTNVVNVNTSVNTTTANRMPSNASSFSPASAEDLQAPPDPLTDLVRSQRPVVVEQRGGSLMEALVKITAEGAHAGILLTTAAAVAGRKRYRKRNGRGKTVTSGKRKAVRKTLKKRK